MDDLISRQAAIDAIKALWNDAPSAQHVSAMFNCEDAIRVLPSAQPEIIRCRECKYRYTDGDNVTANYCLLNHNRAHADDWFCADAEREDE